MIEMIADHGFAGVSLAIVVYAFGKFWLHYVSFQERMIEMNIEQAKSQRDVANMLNAMNGELGSIGVKLSALIDAERERRVRQST